MLCAGPVKVRKHHRYAVQELHTQATAEDVFGTKANVMLLLLHAGRVGVR